MAEPDPLSPQERLALTVEAALRIPEPKGPRPGERPLPPHIYEQMYADREDRIDLVLGMLARDLDLVARAEIAAANEEDAASLAAEMTAGDFERDRAPAKARSARDRAETARATATERRARAQAHVENSWRVQEMRPRLREISARAEAEPAADPYQWDHDEHTERWPAIRRRRSAVDAQLRALGEFARSLNP